MAAAGWGLNTQIHALGDGAPWIAEQARVQFGAQGRYTLDLYHACEYPAAAAPDPAQAKPYVAPLREALRVGRYAEVLATLRTRDEPVDCPNEKAPVRAALRYLGNRTEQLDYASALAHDLPVGSGLIESGYRDVLQARLKKARAWWTQANAHAPASSAPSGPLASGILTGKTTDFTSSCTPPMQMVFISLVPEVNRDQAGESHKTPKAFHSGP